MSSRGVDSLAVVSDGKLKGIVREMDVLRNFHTNKKVSEIMTKQISTIGPNKELEEALERMRKRKVKRLSVVDKGKLIGVINAMDIVAHWSELEINEPFFFD